MGYARDVEMDRKKQNLKNRKSKAKRGPKPEVLKLKGNWQRSIKRSMAKKKPPEGWPN
jgi:hypothetical protein